MGPANRPPNDKFVYCWPSAWAVRSVHCTGGASTLNDAPRTEKLDPERVRTLSWAPLNPPRETSYGEVTSDVITDASRGRVLPPNGMPLSIVAF